MTSFKSLYELNQNADHFFSKCGSAKMILSPAASLDVCANAVKNGLIVTVVEGGIWQNMKFEARLDCIWWGKIPPVEEDTAALNNENARRFIEKEMTNHSAFVITAASYNREIPKWP